MKETFRLVYDGRIADGKTEEEVKEALSSRLKISESAINKILTSNTIVLKKNMDADQAEQYQKAFEGAGLVCRLDSETPPPPAIPPGFMECPNCGHQQPVADDCIKCGVVIAKVQAVKEAEIAKVQAAQNAEKVRLKNLAAAQPFIDFLAEYKELIESDRTFFAPDIPHEKIQTVKKYVQWPDSETPLFLYDKSDRQNAAQGAVITDQGVYFKGGLDYSHRYTWDKIERADFKAGMEDSLVINGSVVSDMKHMSKEKMVIFAEMIQDLKGQKRILIPYGKDIEFPQICCGCLAPTADRGVTVHLNQKPPKTMGRKVGGFALDAVLFNLSPAAFFVARHMPNSSKAFIFNGFVPSEIKLPYCSDCIPRNTRVGAPIYVIETWPGKIVEAGFATVKAGFSWFEIFFDNPDFEEKLIELNQEMVFTTWIDMSRYVPDDYEEEEIIEEPPDDGPVDPAKAFASLVKGLNTFAGKNIPEKKLKNALASFASLGPEETVVGLHDFTVMGSAKEGVVFTDQGVYWKTKKSSGSIRYEDIDPSQIECQRIQEITAVVVAPDKWLPFSVFRVKDLEWVAEYLKKVC